MAAGNGRRRVTMHLARSRTGLEQNRTGTEQAWRRTGSQLLHLNSRDDHGIVEQLRVVAFFRIVPRVEGKLFTSPSGISRASTSGKAKLPNCFIGDGIRGTREIQAANEFTHGQLEIPRRIFLKD